MIIIVTKNSQYYFDTHNKLAWGGKIGNNPKRYYRASLIVGTRGTVLFEDGSLLTTGLILDRLCP